MNTTKPLAFISCRRTDSSAAARWLANTMTRTFGSQCVFIDTESIRAADDWPARIDQALVAASLLIPVIGPRWLCAQDDDFRRRLDNADDWVRNEIRHALEARVRILPVLLSRTPMPRQPRCRRRSPGSCARRLSNFGMNAGKATSSCFWRLLLAKEVRDSRTYERKATHGKQTSAEVRDKTDCEV